MPLTEPMVEGIDWIDMPKSTEDPVMTEVIARLFFARNKQVARPRNENSQEPDTEYG